MPPSPPEYTIHLEISQNVPPPSKSPYADAGNMWWTTSLPEGAEADVIVIVHGQEPVASYRELYGTGRGGFGSPEEADAFLRQERDAWED